jgi:lipopolysaccharide heptosyltransferase II
MTIKLKSIMRDYYLRGRKIALSPLLFWRQPQQPFPKHMIKSILFLRHDRIGDMVVSTAAIKALKKTYPEAHLTVLASERNHPVLEHNPSVNEIMIYKNFRQFIQDVRPRHYDLIIDPFLTHELKQALMTYLAAGRYRIGFEVAGRGAFFNLRGPRPIRPQRMVDHLLELVEYVGADTDGCVPEVFVSEHERRQAAETLASGKGRRQGKGFIVALHPGAYYPSQRWPEPRFGALARMILEQSKARVILLGSPEEEMLVQEVKKYAGEGIEVFSGLTLRGLMAILSQCDLFIGNNSGPLHLASAVKIPTVSLIGPTVTPLWLPFEKNDVVLQRELSCSPCDKGVCDDHTCMEAITVAEVFDTVQSQIARSGEKPSAPTLVRKKIRKQRIS